MKETVKKLVCMIAVVVIVFAVPDVASATSPSDDDYRVTINYDGFVQYDAWDYWWNPIASDPYMRLGELKYVAFYPKGMSRVRLVYDFSDLLSDYYPFMATATHVWMSLKTDMDQATVGEVIRGENTFYSHYNLGSGVVEDRWFSLETTGASAGLVQLPIYDFADNLNGIRSYDEFSVVQRIDLESNAVDFSHSVRVNSFALILYLEGVSGTDIDMTIVVNGGLKDIESAVDQVKDEVKAVHDKLDNVQADMNTGFDNLTGAINGSGADTSGMDNGMVQLGGQLGDLGDVEDQLGGLIMDKVEVPDLILTNDQGSALALLVSCLNLAYVDLRDYQVMFASVLFFGIIGVLLFGRRNL